MHDADFEYDANADKSKPNVLTRMNSAANLMCNSPLKKQNVVPATPQTWATNSAVTPMSANVFNIQTPLSNTLNLKKPENASAGAGCIRKLTFSGKENVFQIKPEVESSNDQIKSEESCNFLNAMLNAQELADSTVNSIFDEQIPINNFSKHSTDWNLGSSLLDGFSPLGDELFPLSMMY